MGLAFNMKYIENVYNRYFTASKASRGKILKQRGQPGHWTFWINKLRKT